MTTLDFILVSAAIVLLIILSALNFKHAEKDESESHSRSSKQHHK
jgi:hypothetical protein